MSFDGISNLDVGVCPILENCKVDGLVICPSDVLCSRPVVGSTLDKLSESFDVVLSDNFGDS